MKVLILGASGMLGHKLLQQLSRSFDVFGTVRDDGSRLIRPGLADAEHLITKIDVLVDDDLKKAIDMAEPDVLINCVGMVKQNPSSGNVINTLLVNSVLPHRLNLLAEHAQFRLIAVSTDCVFLGTKGKYSEDDPPDALDLYGRSKNLGELSGPGSLTIRSSIIGREVDTAHGLIEWFLSNRGGTVKGYSRAIFSGFPTIIFADIIGHLLSDHPGLSGVYHISSEPIDKLSLLKLVGNAYGTNIEIVPDDSFAIDRSLDSSRFREATGFMPQTWEEMIDRMAADPTPYDKFRG